MPPHMKTHGGGDGDGKDDSIGVENKQGSVVMMTATIGLEKGLHVLAGEALRVWRW